MDTTETGNGLYPFGLGAIPRIGDSDPSGKFGMPHDVYAVYVNDDYVGDKVILTQGEDGRHAVQSFLESREFHDFHISRTGNQVSVKTGNSENAQKMKQNLHVYLQIR